MARAVERIEQDIAALEESIALLATQFRSTYSQYLNLLGQAVRQQLILAGYQVCTQGYPESFLGLSFNQRQELQQSLRQLGGNAKEQLLSHLEGANNSDTTDTTDTTDATDEDEPEPEELPIENEQSEEPTEESLVEASEAEESLVGDSEVEASEVEDSQVEDSEVEASDALLETPNSNPESPKKPPTPLEQLAKWQEQVEEAIAKTLQKISLQANRLLHKSGIIPNKLPSAVLEAAAKVEASGESALGSPNLLNLLMETESEDDSDNSTLTRIVAINLRLSEIEFADPSLLALRNQIRNLSTKRRKLQQEYYKRQRERSIAQAEAAWRSSWFED
jgi:hypothetical protein